MSRAAALLGESMLPIKFVAHQCGYSLVNNFYRDFRKVYGTSPLQMRLLGWIGSCARRIHRCVGRRLARVRVVVALVHQYLVTAWRVVRSMPG